MRQSIEPIVVGSSFQMALDEHGHKIATDVEAIPRIAQQVAQVRLRNTALVQLNLGGVNPLQHTLLLEKRHSSLATQPKEVFSREATDFVHIRPDVEVQGSTPLPTKKLKWFVCISRAGCLRIIRVNATYRNKSHMIITIACHEDNY
jgi:hypothetical protein